MTGIGPDGLSYYVPTRDTSSPCETFILLSRPPFMTSGMMLLAVPDVPDP